MLNIDKIKNENNVNNEMCVENVIVFNIVSCTHLKK